PVVSVPPSMGGDVFHGQRARAALLHRTVLAAGLRELYARRRDPADLARDLEWSGLPEVPRRAALGCTAEIVRQLWLALEPLVQAGKLAMRANVSAIIPCLDEEDATGPCVAAIGGASLRLVQVPVGQHWLGAGPRRCRAIGAMPHGQPGSWRDRFPGWRGQVRRGGAPGPRQPWGQCTPASPPTLQLPPG